MPIPGQFGCINSSIMYCMVEQSSVKGMASRGQTQKSQISAETNLTG